MKYSWMYLMLGFLLISVVGFPVTAAYHDTGMRTWSQPDGTKFQARTWGDEFYHWMETKDGYRIVRGDDQWFYYATLGKEGQYLASEYQVGLDTPPAESYKLERSASWKAQRDSLIDVFENGIIQAKQEYNAKQQAAGAGNPVSYTINIVLVEFTDTTHYEDPDPESPHYNGYLKARYDSMFFSQEHFWEDFESELHPEGDSLFGSFRDYWQEQSRGLLQFSENSRIVNPTNPDGTPQWYQLDSTISYYRELGIGTSIDSIVSELYLDTFSGKVGIIYAGPTNLDFLPSGNHNGLWPHAYIGGKYWITGEQYWDNPAFLGDDAPRFAHIGTHCHEFGHTIGFGHTGQLHWSLMYGGGGNGPRLDAACPAGLIPRYRINRGWVSFTDTLEGSIHDFEFEYNYESPKYYKLPVTGSSQFFILEQRLHDGFDLFTPPLRRFADPVPPNGFKGGLLIWRGNTLIRADNDAEAWPSTHMFTDPFPYQQDQDFNDDTTPNSQIYGSRSHIAVQKIHWNDATETVTADIYTNAWGGTIAQNTTLSGNVYIYDNMQVENNATLSISPGTTIEFAPNTGLSIADDAHLEVAGTSSDPVFFTSAKTSPARGDWHGLKLIGASNDATTLEWVTIEYAEIGLSIEEAAPTLAQCIIRDNSTFGVELIAAFPRIRDTEIVENAFVGIDMSYSGPELENVVVQQTHSGAINPPLGIGMRLYQSKPVLSGTVVIDNTRNGLLLYDSRPILKASAIVNNGHPSSDPAVQAEIQFMDVYSLPLMAEGHNDIIDEVEEATYLMYGNYERIPPDPWKVAYNYWGTTDEGVIESRLYPDGDYAFRPFDTAPNTQAGDEVMHEAGEAFQAARTLETDGNLAAAQTAYEDIITTYPNSPEALASVDRIIILATKTERPLADLQAYLENLVDTHPSEAVRTVAKEYLGQLALTARDYATAAALYGSLYTTATTTADSVYALIDQGYVVQQATADSGTGLGKRGPAVARQAAFRPGTVQEFATGKAQLLGVLDGHQSLAAVLRQLNASSTNAEPTTFTVSQNYPNPFNPTTTIRYGVPDAGPVQLVVYDLTGRRIVTLVNTRQASGTYTVTWDGRITTGVPAGSGVYFYRLTQGSQATTGKMVLIR